MMTKQPLKELKLFKTKKNCHQNEVVKVNWIRLVGTIAGLLIGAVLAIIAVTKVAG